MKQLAVVLLTIFALSNTGCDPAYSLWIYNKSGTTHTVNIVCNDHYSKSYNSCPMPSAYYTNYITFSPIDSIHVPAQLIHKDSLSDNWTKSYSFTLPRAKKVKMEGGIGVCPPEQLIIIDNRDTISTNMHPEKIKRKRTMLGGEYILTLDK